MSPTAGPDNNPRNGFMLVTHVIPPTATGQNGAGPAVGFPTAGISTIEVPNSTGPSVTPGVIRVTAPPGQLVKFLRAQPKAVGAAQIMIGIITFMFGIVLTVSAPSVSAYSGIFYWGSLIYIVTGSLTVGAENNLSFGLVKGSLGMNTFSAVTAGTTAVLLSADFTVGLGYRPCYGSWGFYDCESFKIQTAGITGVLLGLSVLQFILCLCILLFGYKATHSTEPPGPVASAPPTQAGDSSVPTFQFQPHTGQQVKDG
ncbi:membrane-spanning 4-domains subfamily A member 4A-like [Salminus brasiliensis]|uniref:membrane-spanning 4-domains subfamily A member 4A-like n=1 Tax=Salminus brasiliensis TaxID=930266 RepID=UPI003B82F19A